MRNRWFAMVAVIIPVVGVILWWRYGTRRRSMPCPHWLSFLLENRYVEAVAGGNTLLDRLDLQAGMKLLDVGSGPGRVSIPAARRVLPDGEIVALDIQAEMLRQLKQKAEREGLANIHLLHAGAGEGKLDKNAFDRGIMVTVLGEISDREAALVEVYEALKPGGLFSITEVLPDPHYQSLATVRRLARQAGFVEVACFGTALAFTVNFKKPLL